MKSTSLLLVILFAFGGNSYADPVDFDLNEDQKIDRLEFARFQAKKRKVAIGDVDTDGDFLISESELLEWADKYSWDAGFSETVIEVDYAAVEGSVPPPKQEAWGLEPLRLRKKHDQLTKDLKDADPASFGFFHNNLTSSDTWAVEGALGAVVEIYDPASVPTLGNYAFDPLELVPSVSLNRITGTGDGSLSEANSLVFRGGLSWGLQDNSGGAALWDYQLFNANYRSSGETGGGDFDSALELEWEPMRSRKGELLSIGGPFRPLPGGFLDFRFVVTNRLEAGESVSGSEDDIFTKLGPTATLYVQPSFAPNLELFAGYSYLWEMADSSPDFDYLDTGVRLALDKLKQVYFEVKYRYGQLPAKYSEIDVIQAALSVKF